MVVLGSGWLIKEGKVRRKRFFVLSDSYQLRYYKSEDTRQPTSGNLHLNWCVIVMLHALH